MGYAEKNLVPGEAILHRARYHWIHYRTSIVILAMAAALGVASAYAASAPGDSTPSVWVGGLALLFVVIGAIHLLVRWIRARADEYVVTSRRVIRKYGLVAREVEQAALEKIQDITVRQSVMGRLLGYGDVVIETASETGRITFPEIADPEGFRNAIWGRAPAPAPAEAAAASPRMAQPAAAPGPGVRERLAELEDLKARNLITPEEYAAKRDEILRGL